MVLSPPLPLPALGAQHFYLGEEAFILRFWLPLWVFVVFSGPTYPEKNSILASLKLGCLDFGVLEVGKRADGAPHLLTSSHTWISFSNKDYQCLSTSPSQVL